MIKWIFAVDNESERQESHETHIGELSICDKIRLSRVKRVVPDALALSNYSGSFVIKYNYTEKSGDIGARTRWPFLSIPIIYLTPPAFERPVADLLIILTHEFVHCRQGWWRIFWENMIWRILRRPGVPPVEKEALEAVALVNKKLIKWLSLNNEKY